MTGRPLTGFDDPRTADAAAARWLGRPGWTTGPPPEEIVQAWLDPAAPLDGTLVGLARAWDPPALTATLLGVVDDGSAPLERRSRAAWLLKTAGAAGAWRAFADRALEPATGRVPRRYLVEALARFAHGGAVGWDDLEPVVAALVADPDPQIRDGAVGILATPPRAAHKRSLLVRLLADQDDTVVAGAAAALQGYGLVGSDLDPALLRRLAEHPSPVVRGAVTDLLG